MNTFLKPCSSEFCLNLTHILSAWHIASCSFILTGRNAPGEYEDVVSGPASINPTVTSEDGTDANQADISAATSEYENTQTSADGGRQLAGYAQPAGSVYEMVHKAENKDDTHVYTMLNC